MTKSSLKAFLFSAIAGFLLSFAPQTGSAFTIDFEGLVDLQPVTNEYAGQGVIFGNATAGVPSPGGTLNEVSFPPTSGVTLVTNEAGGGAGNIEISFTSVFTELSGYFTYDDFFQTGDLLAISVFGSDPVTPLQSMFLGPNVGSPSLVSFSGLGPITSLIAMGGTGTSFTLDDLTLSRTATPGSAVVPEPSSIFLLTFGLAAFSLNKKLQVRN